jgi:hypothetical protein
MIPINLKMGQSTILRFQERPKKVVLGNSNYYSIEFIDNDLAIQPQGAMTTNLFVYGMKNVYGFILRTSPSASYDDLVQVNLKGERLRVGTFSPESLLKEVSQPRLTLALTKNLRVTLEKVWTFERVGSYIFDFVIENGSLLALDTKKLSFAVSRRATKLGPQELVFRQTKIKPGGVGMARLFTNGNLKTDLQLTVAIDGKSAKVIIPRRLL